MQASVKAGLLCDYALTSEDGKLSVMGLFSNMTLATLPGAYPRFFVVLILSLDRGVHAVRLGIVDPVGNQVLPDQPVAQVEVEMPGADTNLVIDFNNLPFERGGIYQVQLFLEERLVHSIPLNVQATASEGFEPGGRPN